MCRNRPGPRCSDHPRQKLVKNSEKIERTLTDNVSIEKELQQSDLTNKRREALEARKVKNLTLLEEFEENKKLLELEYNATPAGRKELEDRILSEVDEEVKESLEVDLQVAVQRRKWQTKKGKEFLEVEQKGEDGGKEALKKAAKEKAAAQKKAEALKLKKKAAQAKLRKARTLTPSQKRKKLIKNLKKSIMMMGAVISFYQLIMNDMDDYLKKKGNALIRKAAIAGSAKVAAAVGEKIFT